MTDNQSLDLGPEDYVRSPKKETKAPSTGADPSPKYMPLRANRHCTVSFLTIPT